MPLPAQGHVLGIDIGFSPKNKSSAVCRLSWVDGEFDWTVDRFKYQDQDRTDTITKVAGDHQLLAAALDGPIRNGFDIIGRYRIAELLLTRKLQPHIGKPGQSSSPVGKRLNQATNEAAQIVLQKCNLAGAQHRHRIHDKAIIEAFPTSFMGLMLEDAEHYSGKRNKKSDRFFEALSDRSIWDSLLGTLYPGASWRQNVSTLQNHDERAALVCALTALCVVADMYSAVGDEDGWIILPPRWAIARKYADLLRMNVLELSMKGTSQLYLL